MMKDLQKNYQWRRIIMMNKVVITNSAEFEEVIQSLEKSYGKIKDLFANERKNVES